MSWFRKYRAVPVIMSALMAFFVWDVWVWFQTLEVRATEDNVFMGAVVTAGVGWFKFYVESGNKEG